MSHHNKVTTFFITPMAKYFSSIPIDYKKQAAE